MPKLSIAAIQASSQADNFEQKWQGVDVPHAIDLLGKAAAQGADLACLPEFYPLVGESELRAAARDFGIHVLAGLADGTPKRWRNTCTLIAPNGEIVGRQTKNYPTAIELDYGVVAGDTFDIFETDVGRFGIVVCADLTFFHDGIQKLKSGGADIVFNPALWFAISGFYPHVIAGRHLEYSLPIVGVNMARRANGKNFPDFPPAGGYSTICVPPPVANMEELWAWFRNKPDGIDATRCVMQSLGPDEGVLFADVDIDAIRRFPGYISR
jgi:predicted amidohydrolase